MALKRYHCFKSSVSYEGTTGSYVKETNVPNDEGLTPDYSLAMRGLAPNPARPDGLLLIVCYH